MVIYIVSDAELDDSVDYSHLTSQLEIDGGGDLGDDDDDVDEATPPSFLQVSVPISKIISDGYRLIYAHPEAFLTAPEGMALIRNPIFEDRVCCVAIDEAHMITVW